MLRTLTTYSLTLLEQSEADHRLLSEALAVYVKSVPYYERTATNEITYWFERYNTKFDDKLLLFAFSQNDVIIGFAEIVHFVSEKILVVDYFTVGNDSESNSSLSEFIEQARAFTEKLGIEYDFIVTELSYNWQSEEPGEVEKIWIAVLKMHGFKLAKASYSQPPLGIDNHESGRPGALMIYSRMPADHIRSETYLLIVDTIYIKHYLRWYEPFLGKGFAGYKSRIRSGQAKIKSQLADVDLVALNGSKHIVTQHRRLPEIAGKDSPQLPMYNFILPSTIAVAVNISLLAAVIKFVDLPPSSAMAIMVVSVLAYISIISVVSKEGAKTLARLIQLIKELARRPK